MHAILETRCRGCGFSLSGIPEEGYEARPCTLCGLAMDPRPNLGVTRRLPRGLGLLMGAFAASLDASPLRTADPNLAPGYARQH